MISVIDVHQQQTITINECSRDRSYLLVLKPPITRPTTKEQHANDTDSIGKDTIDRLQTLGDAVPKVMFNSIANLDKTVAHLRKLGLVTNQYVRGYPRIILTDKGRTFFYSFVYSSFIFKTITELINRLH